MRAPVNKNGAVILFLLTNELIVSACAENPTVEISYSSSTLKPFVDFKSDETVDMKFLKQNNLTRTNVHNCIAKFVPCDYANKISAGWCTQRTDTQTMHGRRYARQAASPPVQ